MAAALIIGVLVLIIAVLAVKIILLRSAADAIAQQFDDRLRADTNTPITLSCRDAHMRQLASAINDALRELRRQRLRYENGDRALKTAVTNISHDLRTPLTAIRGTLDLLEREDASPNTRRHLATSLKSPALACGLPSRRWSTATSMARLSGVFGSKVVAEVPVISPWL